MSRVSRIASVAIQSVVVAAALGAATILVAPRLLGWQTVTVLSGSMAPAYPVNSVLAIDPVNPSDVHEGDVIAFATETDRPMVTHRVVTVQHDAGGLSFVTKGDANNAPDLNPVAASAVRGRVVFGVPYLGRFVNFVHDPIGFAMLIAVPAMLLIGQEILSMRRDRRARKTQADALPSADVEFSDHADELISARDEVHA